MSARHERLLVRAALAALCTMALLSALAGAFSADSGLGWFALALRSFLLGTLGVAGVGLTVAVPLGIVAGAGPRSADGVLATACDLLGVLPAALMLAVGKFAAPGLLGLLCVAGVVRGVGLAWLLRSELSRDAAEQHEIVARSLGHGPLLAFFRERLPSALGPVLTSASLTGAWLVAVEAVATLAGFGPLTSHVSFGAALGRGEHRLAAVLAVALGTAALYVLARSAASRLEQSNDSQPFALIRK